MRYCSASKSLPLSFMNPCYGGYVIVYSLCATRLSEEIMNVWSRISGMTLLEHIARKPIDITKDLITICKPDQTRDSMEQLHYI